MGSGGTDPCRHPQRSGSAGRPRREDLCTHLLAIHPSGLHSRFPGLWTSRQAAYSLAPPSSVLVAPYGLGCLPVCPRMLSLRHLQISMSPNCRKIGPLLIPRRPWSHVRVDFVTDLPNSEGFTCILITVDWFSKACRLIPLKGLPTALERAEALFHHVFRNYGIPEDIVSDRGPQFISHVWKAFLKLLGISVSLSSRYHPQTNGQTERKIQEIGRYLRAYCHDNCYVPICDA